MFSNRQLSYQLSYVFDRPIVGGTMEIRKLNTLEAGLPSCWMPENP